MDVTDLARRLVATPSHEDETAAGDLVESWLADHTDAAVARDDAGNVVARRNAGAGRSLALVGHHDVVPPDDGQLDGGEYVLEERDGRLYGRGAADMKGSLAAAMVAFRDADPAGELVFASFVGVVGNALELLEAVPAALAAVVGLRLQLPDDGLGEVNGAVEAVLDALRHAAVDDRARVRQNLHTGR